MKKIILGLVAVVATVAIGNSGAITKAHAEDAIPAGSADTKIMLKAEVTGAKSVMVGARVEMQQKFKQELEMKRTDIEAMIAQKKEVFAQHVSAIKDENKKQLAIKAEAELNKINQNVSKRLTANLDQLTEFLNKIETQMNTLAGEGKDVTTLKAAIAKADQAIVAAQIKVKAQTLKVYDVQVTSETTLRAKFEAARKQLHNDLSLVRDGGVRPARDAVHDAVQILRTMLSEKVETNSSSQ